MNIRYKANSIIPFFLVNTLFLPTKARGKIITEKSTTHNISLYMVLFSIPYIGEIEEVIPITTKRLKILDPIRLPIDKSFCFFNDATTDAASSGILVPMATIVMLITLWEISNCVATEIADFINVSDPNHNKNPLNIICKNDLEIDILLLSKSSENSDILFFW